MQVYVRASIALDMIEVGIDFLIDTDTALIEVERGAEVVIN